MTRCRRGAGSGVETPSKLMVLRARDMEEATLLGVWLGSQVRFGVCLHVGTVVGSE